MQIILGSTGIKTSLRGGVHEERCDWTIFFTFLTEFYKDGKYDLDFKNPDSDPSKWVRITRNFSVNFDSFVKQMHVKIIIKMRKI